ncbi:hypothetical protein HDC34_001285 [Pseudoclavibacter sp. JAI123]|nr:recombinase family protein [Pseudoclavibacter sp. JAI123]NYF12991.1 hypothetical protein [Pseudoclavibacter sp. JAI123]
MNASRPALNDALRALARADSFVVATLDRLDSLGCSTGNMRTVAEELRDEGVAWRVLSLGGGNVDTSTPMGSMVFTVLAAVVQMEFEMKRERVLDSINRRRAAGSDLGGRQVKISESQLNNSTPPSSPRTFRSRRSRIVRERSTRPRRRRRASPGDLRPRDRSGRRRPGLGSSRPHRTGPLGSGTAPQGLARWMTAWPGGDKPRRPTGVDVANGPRRRRLLVGPRIALRVA